MTIQGVYWAFKTFKTGNWHPITWLTHMMDVELFGINPSIHHMISLFWHTVNALMLCWLWVKATGKIWQGLFVTLIFAVHPFNVEVVAWLAERKTIIAAFFVLASAMAYVKYNQKPSNRLFTITFILAVIAMMSKPVAVTLPVIFLIMDAWPLCRLNLISKEHNILSLIKEKIPLLIPSIAVIFISFYAQHKQGAIPPEELLPLKYRLANALLAIFQYLGKFIVPIDLAILYPHPGKEIGIYIPAMILVFMIITIVLANEKIIKHPEAVFGWTWFLLSLSPTMGIIQVGSQAMADRYMYMPIIGLAIIVWWIGAKIKHRLKMPQMVMVAISISLIITLMVLSRRQTHYWKDGVTIFERSLKVTSNNRPAEINYGAALLYQGRNDEAVDWLHNLQRKDPNFIPLKSMLAEALAAAGKLDEAEGQYREYLSFFPKAIKAVNDYGILLLRQKRFSEALHQGRESVILEPDVANNKAGYLISGEALFQMDRIGEALFYFKEVAKVDPVNQLALSRLRTASSGDGLHKSR